MTRRIQLLRLFQGATAAVLSTTTFACGNADSPGDGGADGGGTGGDGGVVSAEGGHGDGGGDGGVDLGTFTANVCAGGVFNPVAGVTPTQAVGYLEYRLEIGSEDGGTPAAVSVSYKSGSPCSGATNAGACQGGYDAFRCGGGFPVPTYGGERPGPRYACFVYTRGDQVAAVKSSAELQTFLGAVDTPPDAALVAFMDGHTVDCSQNNVATTAGGYLLRTHSGSQCTDGGGNGRFAERVRVSAGHDVTVEQSVLVDPPTICGIGRWPGGETGGLGVPRDRTAGGYLEAAAELEALSVGAFHRLAKDLTALGAPPALVAGARRAAADETRHARAVAGLAKRHGREPTGLSSLMDGAQGTEAPPRSALDVALENAVEGCVGETFGALVAHYQANAATDPVLARALGRIAEDETAHAALAWDLAAWLEPRLTTEEQVQVRAARGARVASLRSELARDPATRDPAVGLPDGPVSVALFNEVAPVLWS